MARYISTKLFENYSVAIRQWKASHSHCELLHGYALKFKVWFASNEPDVDKQLDDMNWIVDYGGFKTPPKGNWLKDWMMGFIESIDMKVFMGPYVKYCYMPGNRGITAVAIIETSHIAMHIWDEPKPALMQLDVYSCGDFNPTDVCNKIMKDFDIHKIEYKYLNRETGLVDL